MLTGPLINVTDAPNFTASANIIAKIANGIADDLLSTICLAAKVPVFVSPAMNEGMWLNPATQHNIGILKSRNIDIIGPGSGFQACGDVGPGRMLEPKEIVTTLKALTEKKQLFKNIRIMITAGPTQEAVDPVRYLTNHSSGKMGYAIAAEAVKLGASVTLISGPVNISPPDIEKCIMVKSARDMHDAVMNNINGTDIYVSTAAVADYRPEKVFEQKYKKSNEDFSIKLVRNPDILAEVANLSSPPFTVGFSAETENLLDNAKAKLKRKKLNMIAANIVGNGKAFQQENNEIIVIDNLGNETDLGFGSKKELAKKLLLKVINIYNEWQYERSNS